MDADILLRLLIAMVLASIIGWDRERRGRSAGIRTNMLVGLSACLFTSTGDLLIQHFQVYGPNVHPDPIRVLQSIVLGVSFLGSGIIFVSHSKDEVRGLTTAASIWTITGVGIVVGLKHYVLATGVTIIVFVILEAMRKVEKLIAQKPKDD